MNKLDYALKLIELLAAELLEEKPNPARIHMVMDRARALREIKE
jgi:hypothetical protein